MTDVSRRTFLKTAGVAGLAAGVGLRASARRAFAQPTSMIGRVVILPKGDVTVHTYVAPPASFIVTSHIIETPNQLVIVDAQFIQSAARDVLAYAESLGKPIERVILSHQHPDHYSGANVFEGVPFVSTQVIADGVQADIDSGAREQRVAQVGEGEVADVLRAPEGGLEAGALTIDGVTFDIQVYDNAEAPQQVVVRLPEQGVVVLQDLLYANAHFFPGLDRANWVSILQGLQAEGGYDTLLPGHGLPTSVGELTQAISYLTFAEEVVASGASAEEVTVALTERYPGYEVEGILGFWGLFIQS
jgi:glyoxylase-like metal-dependent hydrolase (beta-lactamase superfamily II)